jgi:hypothetical protein
MGGGMICFLGQCPVVLTFGASLTRQTILHKPDLCERGTRVATEAMRRHGVHRLVGMAAIGDSAGHGRFVFRAVIDPILLDRSMQDRRLQEEMVRSSGA